MVERSDTTGLDQIGQSTPEASQQSKAFGADLKKHALVVQYSIDGFGTASDFNDRIALQQCLSKFLAATNNGEVQGGDMGTGRVNIFLWKISNIDSALHAIEQVLADFRLLQRAVVAFEQLDVGSYTVVWPKDYRGEFEIL